MRAGLLVDALDGEAKAASAKGLRGEHKGGLRVTERMHLLPPPLTAAR